MEISAYQRPLQMLGQQLEQILAEQDALADALTIRCAVRRGMLMILGQHPAYEIADPSLALQELEAAVRSVPSDLILASLEDATDPDEAIAPSDLIPIQLYLRVDGHLQPYQTYRFIWEPSAAMPPETAIEEFDEEDLFDFSGLPEIPIDTTVDGPLDLITDEDESLPQPDFLVEEDGEFEAPAYDLGDEDAIGDGTTAPDEFEPNLELDELSLAIVPYEDEDGAEAEANPSALVRRQPSQFAKAPLGLLAAGGVTVGFAAFMGALYLFTRPCVVGRCEALATAASLNQTAIDNLSQNPSAQTVAKSHDQVQEANRLLSAIPPWSSQHQEAQTLILAYEQQANELSQIMLAQKQAMSAAEKSQNPPHPVSHWVEIQELWQQAIAQLEQISPDSLTYPYVQQKLTEYRNNLSAINHRIKAEQAAESALNTALASAQKAEALSNAADSLTSWQLAHADWQRAMNQLRQIPQGTMAYREAQILMVPYQEKLDFANTRRTQEQLGEDAYNRGIRLADQARRSEQQDQWTQAVQHWQNALANIQQVPNQTAHHAESQTLLATYQDALVKAQNGLRAAVALQKTRTELSQTCAGTPTVCTYLVTPTVIQVRLTSDYDRSVERAMVTAAMRQDSATQVQIAQHVNTLLKALTTIGDNAGIPVELYDANDALLGRYVPGFMPR